MLRSTASKAMWAERVRLCAVLLAVMVALALGYAAKAYAAPGDLDPLFDGDGKVATDFSDAFNDSGLDVAVQEDGKIVVAGNVTSSGTGVDFAVARYRPNGSPDPTFGSGGQVITPVGAETSNDEAYGIAVRPDGKIVAAGFTTANGTYDFAAVRYNEDGSLDTDSDSDPATHFDTDGKVITPVGNSHDLAVDIAVQGTQTILTGRSYNGSNYDFAMVRYDDNGNLDNSFGTGGVVTTDFFGDLDYSEDITIEPGGKIVLAGLTRDPNNTANRDDFAVARYNSDGSLDTSSDSDPATHFDTDGKVTTHFGSAHDSAYGVVVQEDGKIVVGGKALNGSREDFALARYNTDGRLDDEFDFDGKVMTDFGGAGGWLWDLALQDDGRIVAAGTSGAANTGANFAITRYNTDGSLNSSFSNDGRVMTDFFGYSDEARSVALQEDGKIVAAGITYNPAAGSNFALARYFGGNDATPPKVEPPAQALLQNSTLGRAAVPVRLSWSATDLHGEVTRYELQQSRDGGSYANVNLPSATAVNRSVVFGSNYRFRVRATDDNGNRSIWKYGPRFTAEARQENDASVAYAGTWKAQSVTSASGGVLKYSTTTGATAKLTFTGHNVAWVSPKALNRGKAEVYLDGKKVATVDLYSSKALARKVVYSASGLDPAVPHTLEVKVLGTKTAASSGVRVDVDAFVVLR